VENGLAIEGEAAAAVGHDTATLSGANGLTQVGFGVEAVVALPALRRIEGDDVITDLQTLHTGPHFHHDTSAFMAENGGECAFRIIP